MEETFSIELQQQADYRFEVRFDNPAVPRLITDEDPPLGEAQGPSPARLLAAAVANCLSASLVFALRKFKLELGALRTTATLTIGRNAEKRLRVQHIAAELHLPVPAAGLAMLDRVLAQFEAFCIVTQSVRAGVPVTVRVFDNAGTLLHQSE